MYICDVFYDVASSCVASCSYDSDVLIDYMLNSQLDSIRIIEHSFVHVGRTTGRQNTVKAL